MTPRRWLFTSLVLLAALALAACAAPAAVAPEAAPAEEGAPAFPPGKMVVFDYGQPQYWQQFFENYLEDNPDVAPGVTVEMVQTEGEADARQKVILSYTAGAYDELPDAVASAPVSMKAMAEGGILMDVTEYVESFEDRFVDGALDQLYYKGSIWCLPKDLRPQLLFYNNDIFEQYGIDPAEMSTFEGYVEVGRKLKEASNGEVFLSYIDPGAYTWRYWGRRGLMPQAEARIWDDEGNVVIDTDPGTQLALGTLESLYSEGLLYSTTMFQPPLYDATREGKIATYYIGAFWDEFLRQNVPDMEGKWRVMSAPVFEEIGLGGAPVVGMQCLIDKPNPVYADLYKLIWEDYHFNAAAREKWTNQMVEQNAPYSNPIARELLEDEFWKEPEPFYGGQSFREMEGKGLENPSQNLRVTEKDAEADQIISAEIEKWVAGSQTMDEAIANMGQQLRDRIGQAPTE
ncbi:MAG: extracellular solute-binding protein [Chloroflexota bacterium]|nr:extracellular solute-binding protein [Chloroflexota bacterium]